MYSEHPWPLHRVALHVTRRRCIGWATLIWLVTLSAAGGCTPTSNTATATGEIEPLSVSSVEPKRASDVTRAPWIRVTWTRDLGDSTDVFGFGDELVLMAYDSRDDRGERVVLNQPASFAKPLITPSGAGIVFSIRQEHAVYTVRWDGSGLRRVADGFGLAVWTEPATGHEWVYVGVDPRNTDPLRPAYHAIRRYRLNDPEIGELVWDVRPVNDDGFQLSADGRYASALFPWPNAGVADLSAGTWKRLAHGCWTALARDDSHVFWYFDAQHRNLTLVDVDTDRRWTVNINGAPGINGYEVYHPRWTNEPKFLVLTGPYTVGDHDNRIRGGGRQVEVYLGRFNAQFTAVEHWTQITHNDLPDFYPDAWIEPGSWSEEKPGELPSIAAAAGDSPVTAASARLIVDVRVLHETPVPSPRSIAPYRHGLLAMEYQVVNVLEGIYDDAKLVAAHWVIREP